MTEFEANTGIEELEQANRRRLVARAIADLHYTNEALELGLVIADDGLPFGEGESTTAHASSDFYLHPFYDEQPDGTMTYAGFTVQEAVAEGGACHTIVYEKTDKEPKISLDYDEYLLFTSTIAQDGNKESSTPESIARTDYGTALFVARAHAAYLAVHNTADQKAKFARQARRIHEGNIRLIRSSFRIPLLG